MKRSPLPGVGDRDLFVEFDPEARLFRRDDITLLPADRLFQEPRLEAVPALDALQNEEIRAAGRKLDIGRADDRPAIEMRRDLSVVSLRHRGDLFGLQETPDPAQIHLQDRGRAGP